MPKGSIGWIAALFVLWPLGYLTFYVWYKLFRSKIDGKKNRDGGWGL